MYIQLYTQIVLGPHRIVVHSSTIHPHSAQIAFQINVTSGGGSVRYGAARIFMYFSAKMVI